MLRELDPVVGIDDPHLGHHLGVWRPQAIAWAVATEPPRLATLAELKRENDDFFFCDRFRDAWMPPLRDLVRRRFAASLAAAFDGSGGRGSDPLLLVKEPGSQAAPMLFELFPGSRLVFLLRDGRDVVDSWLDAYSAGSWAIEGGAFPVTAEGRPALASWLGTVWAYRVRAVGDAFARLPSERRVLVRYEDLRRNPVDELSRVCTALAIDVARGRLEQIAARHAFEVVAPARRGALRAARSAEPGRWRRRSTAEQRAMIDSMATELGEWGYSEPQRGVA
jgi:hypothetical protein